MWCRRLVLDMSCATGSIESLTGRFEFTVAEGLLLLRLSAESGSHFGLQPSCRGRAPWPQ